MAIFFQIQWYVAIDLPGGGQMKFLRRLLESRPMLDRVTGQVHMESPVLQNAAVVK